jgi:hypothetical protein
MSTARVKAKITELEQVAAPLARSILDIIEKSLANTRGGQRGAQTLNAIRGNVDELVKSAARVVSVSVEMFESESQKHTP